MIIDGTEYTILKIEDELKSHWKDGRPWIQEFYELQDEAGDLFYLTIWSDHYELVNVPISPEPFLLLEGDISEIRGQIDETKFR